MTFILRRSLIGAAVLLALTPAARAVMPPYTTTYAETNTSAKEGDKSQGVSNAEVLQALQENKKLMQELLQRLDTLQISSAALKTTR